jgi:hypothetical protein
MKKVFYFVLFFILLQVFQPESITKKVDEKQSISTTPEVLSILKRSCFDCHSYETKLPFYSKISPVSFFLNHHIVEGRKELNFSEWETLSENKKQNKAEEIWEEIQSGEMPLSSYTLIHSTAKLTAEDKLVLKKWLSAYLEEEKNGETRINSKK